ncbi:MAG: hypothetical protein ACLP7Q_21655 [Isosphaeraceae bacterium]
MCLSLSVALVISVLAAPPSVLEPLGKFDPQRLPEVSGIVKSRRHPGIFWVHNDSGNPPVLFAIHKDGTIVREFRLAVPNIDWEDIAIDNQGHLYLGDIGNNGGLLALRVVYRIDEPDPATAVKEPLAPSASSFYVLPRADRFDAEGIFCEAGSGSVTVLTKRFDGREAELLSIPFRPPAPLLRPAKPRLIGVLPGFVEPATGASLSPDGRLLAVCSETVTRIYQRGESPPWNLLAEVRYESRPIEGIAWDAMDLIAVSEGRGVDRIAGPTWMRLARGELPPGLSPSTP